MTTAAQLIDRATGLIGVRAIGQSLSGDVAADCYEYLKMMLDAWRLESGLTLTTKIVATLPANQTSYTIAPGGDIDATTPMKILGAFSTINGSIYGADIVPENYFDSLDIGVTSNIPEYFFFDGLNLKIYPVMSQPVAVTLTVKGPLPVFTTITTDIPLSAGMESAIASNLAVLLAPVCEKQASQTVMLTAANSKRALKQSNFASAAVDCPIDTGKSFDIIAGN